MRFAAAWLGLFANLAGAAPHDAELAAVRALYARFAAEAVIDDAKPPSLEGASPAVWREHFSRALVELWRRDRACVQRSGEPCRVDFQVIWDSQDPVGTTVKLRWDESRRRVVATLRGCDREQGLLAYALVRENGRWRIDDIDYGAGRESLKQRLAAPYPR